jgi:hypothetical protein
MTDKLEPLNVRILNVRKNLEMLRLSQQLRKVYIRNTSLLSKISRLILIPIKHGAQHQTVLYTAWDQNKNPKHHANADSFSVSNVFRNGTQKQIATTN